SRVPRHQTSTSACRSRDAVPTESVVALLREPRQWTEGHVVVRGSSLTFTPLRRPAGDGSISETVAAHTVIRETRIRLFTEYGLRLARTWQLSVEGRDGKQLLFALRCQDCVAVSAALKDAPRSRSREEPAR